MTLRAHTAVQLLSLFLPLIADAQQLQLLSVVGPAGTASAGGGGDSGLPIISPDGRFVLFASTANNLVLSSNHPLPAVIPPPLNVFLRNLSNKLTTLVSVDITGSSGGNGDSLPVSLSTNLQFVLFESAANNLVLRDTNNLSDVFVRDVINGATFLVSAATNGSSGNGTSRGASMTPDGRY